MRTFDASLPARTFWGAAIGPPVFFFALVQCSDSALTAGISDLLEVLLLLGLAQAMPVAALAWTLCGVAAYSVGPGRLVVHRVVADREYPLSALNRAPALAGGMVRVEIGHRTLSLRVAEPENLLAALRAAAPITVA